MSSSDQEQARQYITAYLAQVSQQRSDTAADAQRLIEMVRAGAANPADGLAGLASFLGQRHQPQADGCEAGQQLLAASRDVQAWAVVESVRRAIAGRESGASLYLATLRSALLRKKLPFTEAAIFAIVDALLSEPRLYQIDVGLAGLAGAFESFVASHGLNNDLRERLERLAQHLDKITYADYRKAAARLQKLLGEAGGGATVGMIQWRTDEPWVEHLRDALAAMGGEVRGHWTALLLHCNSATSSKPSQKWLKQATALLGPVGQAEFVHIAVDVLAQIGKPARTPPQRNTGLGDQTDVTLIHDDHADLLRGLVWCTSLVNDERLTAAVGAAADACFHKIAWIGPRAPKIGNACLFALSQRTELKAVAELSRLKTRVKHASAKKQLGKSLDAAADRAGMSSEELEEIAVPTCDLTSVGTLVRQLGDVAARLEIGSDGKADISWQPAGKKAQASVPASIKDAFADDIKAIKKSAKEIEKLLPAQRTRLERLFLQQASWSFRDFRSRYLDHPLVGTLARRLVWHFEDAGRQADGIWSQDRMVAADDRPLEWLRDETRVTLWHPSAASAAEVLAWRNWLEAHEVRQPFKQAHREIYLLTDAERATAIYSNRFAAHILRQHQFAALCRERGWSYRLEGNFDSANTPYLDLPRWELRVEFWVGGVATDMSQMGIYLYVSTDQVRFMRRGQFEPLPLTQVLPLLFSEVMRDVDLFVGVCSVGNDPNWHTGGPQGQFREYWGAYAFGELSASGATRREVLQRIIPRLQIADRCSFLDRYLVVHGTLHTYKIHLGSGNILMSPNDQYLCIVPQRSLASASSRVFLPFDGDEMLSIILSKAMLLADDTKISDATIVRQLQG